MIFRVSFQAKVNGASNDGMTIQNTNINYQQILIFKLTISLSTAHYYKLLWNHESWMNSNLVDVQQFSLSNVQLHVFKLSLFEV